MRRAEKRWRHSWYRQAYCYPRTMKDGSVLVYTSVDTVRKATGIEWKPQNKVHAMRILERRRAEAHQPAIAITTTITTQEAVETFIQYKLSRQSKNTIKSYMQAFERYLTAGHDLNNYIAWQKHFVEINKLVDISNSSKSIYLTRIKTFFKFCMEKRWCDYNPVSQDIIPKAEAKGVAVPSDDELLAILRHLNAKTSQYVKFICITSMRRAEALALTADSIKEDHIYIRGKQNRDRIFPTNIDILNKFNVQDELFDLSELLQYIPFGWITTYTPNKNVTNACEKLGIHYTMHSFRKWAINRWRSIGINTELRSLLAGHSVAVQYKHYASMANIDYFNDNFRHHFTSITHER